MPYQALWKYANLLAIPEEKTVERMVRKVGECRLLDRLVSRAVEIAKSRPYALVRRPEFLALLAFLAQSALEDLKVDLVLSMSELGLPLATVLALELHAELCHASSSPVREVEGLHVLVCSRGGEVKLLAVPKSCLREKDRAPPVDLVVDDVGVLREFVELVRARHVEPRALVAAVVAREAEAYRGRRGVPLGPRGGLAPPPAAGMAPLRAPRKRVARGLRYPPWPLLLLK